MGSGKSGSTTETKAYDYYGTIAGAVCLGTVDELAAVIVDGIEVWPKGGSALARGANPYDDVSIANYGTLRIYWGTDTQTADPELTGAGNDKAESHPAYKGLCYVILKNFLFGRERVSAPNVEVVVRRKPLQAVVTGDPADLSDDQANIMAIAADILTNPQMVGLPVSRLDSTSFNAAATTLDASASVAACSPLVDSVTSLLSVLEEAAWLADAFWRFDAASNKIVAGLFSHGSSPSGAHSLTNQQLTEPPALTADGLESMDTGAQVAFADRERAYKTSSEKVDDLRAYQVIGEHRRRDLKRGWITRRSQALAHAAETLRSIGRPQLSGTLSVRREHAREIEPGDYVLVDIDLEPGGASLYQYARVVQKELPFLGPVTLLIEADEYLTALSYTPSVSTSSESAVAVPAISNHRIVECPARLASDSPSVLVLAERPTMLCVGVNLWFDTSPTGTFDEVGTQNNWALRGTCLKDLSSSGTALNISVPAQADYEWLEEELTDVIAADDALLAFLVEISSGAVAEDADGYAKMELCSIAEIADPEAWATATSYVAGDIVTSANLTYQCILAHTSEAGNAPPNATYWTQTDRLFTLTLLRARQGTQARAFTASTAELWIIPRGVLVPLYHKEFADLQANRVAGTTPDTAYFRLQASTWDALRDLADCSNITFQFPLKRQSAPKISLTSPASDDYQYPADWLTGTGYVVGDYVWQPDTSKFYRCKSAHTSGSTTEPGVGGSWATVWDDISAPTAWATGQSYSAGDVRGSDSSAWVCIQAHTSSADNAPPATMYWDHAHPYGYEVEVEGTVTDPDNDLVAVKIYSRKDGGAWEEEEDDSFAPTGSYSFSEDVMISDSGDWEIRIDAIDSLGLVTTKTIEIAAPGSIDKCKRPKFYDRLTGKKLSGTEWNFMGELDLKTKTDGATIYFRYYQFWDYTGGIVARSPSSGWYTYAEDGDIPDERPLAPECYGNFDLFIEAKASKTSYVDSEIRTLRIKWRQLDFNEVM